MNNVKLVSLLLRYIDVSNSNVNTHSKFIELAELKEDIIKLASQMDVEVKWLVNKN